MATKSSSKDSKAKVFDVSKPGKTPASATSRPIIVGHGAVLRDPMVTNDAPSTPSAPTLGSISKKVIAPLSKEVTVENPKPSKEESIENAAVDTPKPEPHKKSAVTPSTEDITEAKPESQEPKEKEAAIDAAADKAIASKEAEVAEKAIAEQQKAIEKLVADKTYFVPIAVARRKRRNAATLIVLVVLLVLAGGYLAVDAGLIETSITLPVDFISN